MLPVLFTLLLNCIVSQVDQPIGQLPQRELLRAGPNIPISVEVGPVALTTGDHHVAPDIKLPFEEQVGDDVLLDDEGALAQLGFGAADMLDYVRELPEYLDTVASVAVFTWLHDPDVPDFTIVFPCLLFQLEVLLEA